MIKKAKDYLKGLKRDLAQLNYAQDQQWATQKLQSLFANGHFIPQTGWSMTPQAIVHALNIISIEKPQNIIEFGSGATTLYIAKLLKTEQSNSHFFSVESDMDWKNEMEHQLEHYGLTERVTLIHAPLKKAASQLCHKDQQTWYDTEAVNAVINEVEEFDLVIVDGPFGGSTPFARYSAYPFLKDKCTEKTIYLLDDTNRAHELEILNEWQRRSGLNKRSFARYCVLSAPSKFDCTPYRMQ